jgi:DNA-binding CsgD family transcriptional regulator
VLVGRSAELDRLVGVARAARLGSAEVALIGGDAGIGKTRLVNELAGWAGDEGFTVLVGQCAELGDTIPYLPLADALRGAPAELVAHWPVLRRLLPGGRGESDDEAVGSLTQQRLFGSTMAMLAELSAERPVLLVFEDLHWADHSTRDLLVFLTRMLQTERVCLLGTYRTDDLHRRHPLRPLLAELRRLPAVTAIELGPLSPDEMADHLTTIDGGDPAAIDAVIARAEGNPFYAEELLAAYDGGLPDGVADLLMARVERLSELALGVLRTAAVAGRRADHDLLGEVSGLDAPRFDEAIREILSQGLLLRDGYGYLFRHALLREAVYLDLLPGERTRLHTGFANVLTLREGPIAELAHHHLASHDLPGAFAASVEAGRRSARLGAPAEAHRHFDQALSLWDRVPDPDRVAGTDRATLGLWSAVAAADSGDNQRAISQLRKLPPAAEINERLAYYLTEINDEAGAMRVAQAAVDAGPEGALLARVLATYARALVWTSRHGETEALASRALKVAESSGAVDAENSALIVLASCAEYDGDLARAESLLERATARRSADLSIDLRAIFVLARIQFEQGELAAAAPVADHGVRMALETGLTWSTYGTDLRFLRFLIHYVAGEWDQAQQLAAGFGIRVGTPAEATLSSFALFVEVARGLPAVEQRLAGVRGFWDASTLVSYMSRGLAADHALWRGEPETALDHVRAVLDILDPQDPGAIRIAATGLAALADLGRHQGADDLLARARQAVAVGHVKVEGRAWLARAEAEWHRVHGTDTPAMWAAVVSAFDFGFRYEVARSRRRLAESLLAAGDRENALAEWRAATISATALGAAPLSRALADLGRRARFTSKSDSAADGLTDREREVLALIADGHTNREIAERLFIAQKTVSVHVSNILAKLGVSSRTQAAALLLNRNPR